MVDYDAALTSILGDISDEVFEDISTGDDRYTIMTGTDNEIVIADKRAHVDGAHIGGTILNETMSKMHTFIINRYHDGVDLSTKDIYFIFKRSDGQVFKRTAKNVEKSDSHVKFSWIIDSAATAIPGLVTVDIVFSGLSEKGDLYVYRINDFMLNVTDALLLSSLVNEDEQQSWVEEVEARLYSLENSGGSSSGGGGGISATVDGETLILS